MCNAYGLRAPVSRIGEVFHELRIPLTFEGGAAPNLPERDPVRPTEAAPVVRPLRPDESADEGAGEGEGARLVSLKWGFAPPKPKAGPIINFRSEGRRFAVGARALAPVSWFYEFTGDRSPKTRWRFTKAERGGGPSEGEEDPFALAALIRPAAPLAASLAGDGAPPAWPESFTLLTCEPGPDVAPIHPRQVVVLERADWARWLFAGAEEAASLLRPAPEGTLCVARDR